MSVIVDGADVATSKGEVLYMLKSCQRMQGRHRAYLIVFEDERSNGTRERAWDARELIGRCRE